MSDHCRLIPPFRALSDSGGQFVLATIVATGGSTYRKAGACMILSAAGQSFGQLAGGSFERDLLRAAEPGFAEGTHRLIDFEMPGHGDTDSAVRILLQYHGPGTGCRALPLMAQALETPSLKILLSVTESTHPEVPLGAAFLFEGNIQPPLPAGIADEVTATAGAALASGECVLVQHPFADGDLEIFYLPIRSPLQLLLVGATPDAEPVARMAGQLGWQITVVDPRGEYCNPARFPDAQEVSRLDAAAMPSRLHPEEFDAAVLLTRSFELDAAFLQSLLATPIPFIGILGSRSRCAKLIEGLGPQARQAAGRVHGPVGLDLRAETPEEIALSIVAQVQATRDRRIRPVQGSVARALPVHAVILAAGGSKRFGGFKQLLELQGESLLRRAVGLAGSVLPGRIIVVHGPKPLKCRRELAGVDVTHVDNGNWEGGMATSLRAGIRAVPAESAAALVLLCDQPLVRPEHLAALLDAWQASPERIAAAAYGGGTGVPAIIPRKYFADILKLSGDRGAKALLAGLAADVVQVAIPEAELDIDTQEDYAAILKRV